jgi:8-amino-7-oxononanoate synthase
MIKITNIVALLLLAGEPALTLHTCGKGLGVEGALVCGAKALIDTLVNKARAVHLLDRTLTADGGGGERAHWNGSQVRKATICVPRLHARIDAAARTSASRLVCIRAAKPDPPLILGDDRRTMDGRRGLPARWF